MTEVSKILSRTVDFNMVVGPDPDSAAGRPAYLLVNRKTDVIEAVGYNYASTLIALKYLQDEHSRIMSDIEGEYARRVAKARAHAENPFAAIFGNEDEDPGPLN